MITCPSSTRLIDAARQALRENIAPALNDPVAINLLGMVDSLLDNAARRCGHEIAWMREEIAAIEAVANKVRLSGANTSGSVEEALADLRDHRVNCADSDHTMDVVGEYNRAGEVLSRCLEIKWDDINAAAENHGALRAEIEAVLDARLAREAAMRGNFMLVGRE